MPIFWNTRHFSKRIDNLSRSFDSIRGERIGPSTGGDAIPAIQPVINNDLTLLTASFGMRIHPFYKSLSQHNGVDFTLPKGSRVFATADGTVTGGYRRNSSTGLTVTTDHGNGYQTRYGHLSKTSVKRGQKVNRETSSPFRATPDSRSPPTSTTKSSTTASLLTPSTIFHGALPPSTTG